MVDRQGTMTVSMARQTWFCLLLWWVIWEWRKLYRGSRTVPYPHKDNRWKKIPFILKTDMTQDFSRVTCQDNTAIKFWFHSSGGIFRSLKEIASDTSTALFGTNVCQITKNFGCLTSHPCATWGNAAASLMELPQTTHTMWVDQKSGLT